MSGKLFLVGTPIGNLQDFSPRGIQTLKEADVIAAEDTRVTRKLLSYYRIATPLISYYRYNQKARESNLLTRMEKGENVALVSDAGMPCISDPGQELVDACFKRGIEVSVIPGPSAHISALCLSGLPTARFCFEGFLSVNRKNRLERLEQIRSYPETLIFYEAPHKLIKTLQDLYETLGDRQIAIAKEITKLHERIVHTTLQEAIAYYREHTPRGEYVLIVKGKDLDPEPKMAFEEAVAYAAKKQEAGLPLSAAAKEAAAVSGYGKSVLYKALLLREKE